MEKIILHGVIIICMVLSLISWLVYVQSNNDKKQTEGSYDPTLINNAKKLLRTECRFSIRLKTLIKSHR